MEVIKQTKIKTIFSIAAVGDFPINVIKHQERQIKPEKS
jgi:hypothetical protein